jgi:hypothetical protein
MMHAQDKKYGPVPAGKHRNHRPRKIEIFFIAKYDRY